MGKPLKIERIGDMPRLLLLESVITEASLMTRNIKLHSILMNWMCFPLQVWGGFAPPAKNRGVWGAAPPNQKYFEKFRDSRENLGIPATIRVPATITTPG